MEGKFFVIFFLFSFCGGTGEKGGVGGGVYRGVLFLWVRKEGFWQRMDGDIVVVGSMLMK